jgi:hypothetical protein
VWSVPEGERRPIDPSSGQTIGGKEYPGERVAGQPKQTYTPPPKATTGGDVSGLAQPGAGETVLFGGEHPLKGGKLEAELEQAPKKGSRTVALGKAETPAPTPMAVTPAPIEADVDAPAKSKVKSLSPGVTPDVGIEAPAVKQAPVRAVPRLTSRALEEAQRLRASNRGALVATGVGLAVGLGMGLYQDWMREAVARMPKPEQDQRSMDAYLKAPNGPIRVLDLMSKSAADDAAALEAAIEAPLGAALAVTLLLGASSYTAEERVQALGDLREYIHPYVRELVAIDQAIDNALAYEADGLKTADDAVAFANLIQEQGKVDVKQAPIWLFFIYNLNLSIDEILAIEANLRAYARATRKAFRSLREFEARHEALLERVQRFDDQLSRLYWGEILTAAKALQEQQK